MHGRRGVENLNASVEAKVAAMLKSLRGSAAETAEAPGSPVERMPESPKYRPYDATNRLHGDTNPVPVLSMPNERRRSLTMQTMKSNKSMKSEDEPTSPLTPLAGHPSNRSFRDPTSPRSEPEQDPTSPKSIGSDAPSAISNPENPDASQIPTEKTALSESEAPRADWGGFLGRHRTKEERLRDMPVPSIEKAWFMERLAMEIVVTRQFLKMLVFIIHIALFCKVLYVTYPTEDIRPVHASIKETLNLDDFPETPTNNEVFDYLTSLVDVMAFMTPNSMAYLDDSKLLRFFPEPVDFTEAKTARVLAEQPDLTHQFTMLAWAKTTQRMNNIMTKRKGADVCWTIGLEYLQHGGHEGDVKATVHPKAASIHSDASDGGLFVYLNDGMAYNRWQHSQIHDMMSDGKWHHVGVQVDSTVPQARFIYDGMFFEWLPMARGLTDCPGGIVTAGEPGVPVGACKEGFRVFQYSFVLRVFFQTPFV